MSWSSRNREREALLRELRAGKGRDLFRLVQQHAPASGPVPDWGGLRTRLRVDGLLGVAADPVLRTILLSRQDVPTPPWSAALLYLFLGTLAALHRRKSRWDRDEDALWANIQWCFLEAIHRIDPATRPARLGQKIYNDTAHRLHDHYRADWDQRRREVAIGSEELPELADLHPGIDFDGIELRSEQRSREKQLWRLLQRGRITEVDLDLELGTRIYAGSLAEYAAVVGLNYQVVKKRRQRLRARLKTYRR